LKHLSSLSREELAETGDEAGFLTIGSSPGFSPSPFLINNEWRALADCFGRRSRLSDYSGGTVWESHPLPFYPIQGTSVRISEINKKETYIINFLTLSNNPSRFWRLCLRKSFWKEEYKTSFRWDSIPYTFDSPEKVNDNGARLVWS